MKRTVFNTIRPKDRAAARALMELPNVGPAVARDLLAIGVRAPADLRARDADEMYAALNAFDGVRHDPCCRDVFAALVAFANGAPARPWWHYTPERKRSVSAKR